MRWLILFLVLTGAGCASNIAQEAPVPEIEPRNGRIWQAEWDQYGKPDTVSIRYLGATYLKDHVRYAWRMYATKPIRVSGIDVKSPSVLDIQVEVGRDQDGGWAQRLIEGVKADEKMGIQPGPGVVHSHGQRVGLPDGPPENSVRAISSPAPGPDMKLVDGLPDALRYLSVESK